MITCPWCGTNYLQFQSNCKNCGGPIALPERVEASEDAPQQAALPNLPPAPRPIANRYAWRLLVSDGWAITGGVFILVGGIFVVVGASLTLGIITAFVGIPFALLGLLMLAGGAGVLAWRYDGARKTVHVLQWGEAACGQILEVTENYAVRVNQRHPWTITYRYQVNGQSFEGKVTTLNPPGARLQPGMPACVLYLASDPRQNAIYPHP